MPVAQAIEFAYIGVEVADVAAVGDVLSNVAGLQPAGPSAWRNDDRVQRVFLTEGPSNDAAVIGYEVADAATAAAVAARLTSLGFVAEPGSAADCVARHVDGLWRTTAPWGVPVEVVHGLGRTGEPFASPLVPGGFKTGPMGFGHCVFMVGDAEAAHRFVVDGLGLNQTDWLDLPIAPGITVSGRFYHGNARHHSLALIAPPGPPPAQRLHHVMFETQDRDDVGAAFDRAFAAGLPIPNGLGKHDNDKMFSFYMQTPAGFQIEIGHGAREVGPDWSENRAYDRISMWGHQPVGRATEPLPSPPR